MEHIEDNDNQIFYCSLREIKYKSMKGKINLVVDQK